MSTFTLTSDVSIHSHPASDNNLIFCHSFILLINLRGKFSLEYVILSRQHSSSSVFLFKRLKSLILIVSSQLKKASSLFLQWCHTTHLNTCVLQSCTLKTAADILSAFSRSEDDITMTSQKRLLQLWLTSLHANYSWIIMLYHPDVLKFPQVFLRDTVSWLYLQYATLNTLTLLPIKPLIIRGLLDFGPPRSFYFVTQPHECNLIL